MIHFQFSIIKFQFKKEGIHFFSLMKRNESKKNQD